MEAAEVRGGRVLVVDDDPDVRDAVETALELEGHSVMSATDGLASGWGRRSSTRWCWMC